MSNDNRIVQAWQQIEMIKDLENELFAVIGLLKKYEQKENLGAGNDIVLNRISKEYNILKHKYSKACVGQPMYKL